MLRSLIYLVALAAAACSPRNSSTSEDELLAVEVAAARDLTGRYRPGSLTVDSAFAAPGQAPPAMTQVVRPAGRHRALVDAVQSDVAPTSLDTLQLRLSEPQITPLGATVFVTIGGRLQIGHSRGGFYETVRIVLRRDGQRWVIRDRDQLGIS